MGNMVDIIKKLFMGKELLTISGHREKNDEQLSAMMDFLTLSEKSKPGRCDVCKKKTATAHLQIKEGKEEYLTADLYICKKCFKNKFGCDIPNDINEMRVTHMGKGM